MQTHSLTIVARQQLEAARQASSSRAAITVYGGHEHSLRQTVIALIQGQSLAEHSTQGEATLQVLSGQMRLSEGELAHDAAAGDLVVTPDGPHSVFAVEDTTLLLTVVVKVESVRTDNHNRRSTDLPRGGTEQDGREAPLDQPIHLSTRAT